MNRPRSPWLRLSALREQELVAATHNAGKVREIGTLLGAHGLRCVAAGALRLPEPEETETTFQGNALLKARAACAATGRATLADDSGVCVDGLDGQPGIYTARWAGEPRDWQRAMERVHAELLARDTEEARSRRASFVCALALVVPVDPAAPELETEVSVSGRVPGTLVWPPRGTLGAGFEPMFVPAGETRTYGEMSAEERLRVNHRAVAFERLMAALR